MSEVKQALLERFKNDLSPWAICIAADPDGYVWEYSKEPPLKEYGWGMPSHPFEMRRIGRITGIDWRETLTPVN